jgi:hypothetical protein
MGYSVTLVIDRHAGWIRPTHNRAKRRTQSLSLLLGEKARMRAVVTTNC